jgi:hypothetical protein
MQVILVWDGVSNEVGVNGFIAFTPDPVHVVALELRDALKLETVFLMAFTRTPSYTVFL